jgi:hypothetical protein
MRINLPNYNFLNTQTEEVVTFSMSIAELDIFKKENPHMIQQLSATPLADPTRVGVRTKPDTEFRNLLKHIGKQHRGSIINSY